MSPTRTQLLRNLPILLLLLCVRAAGNPSPMENETLVKPVESQTLRSTAFQELVANDTTSYPKKHCASPGKPCVSFCCELGYFLENNTCRRRENPGIPAPRLYSTNLQTENATVDAVSFQILVWNPCEGGERFPLNPDFYSDERWYLLSNGSVYKPEVEEILAHDEYCLTTIRSRQEYFAMVCFFDVIMGSESKPLYSIGMMASVPFLVTTFIVYSIIPELKNLHGLTLRGYVGCLAVAYILLVVVQLTPQHWIPDSVCTALAITINFSFLASFFWLNVMCFDIWWTFGGFRSLQGSVKQRERKKFIMYSIYAWGSSSLLTGVCIVMDFAPGVPENFIRPQFGTQSCWYTTDAAKAIYFYGPMGVTVLCNIYLFISTALKIIRHKKDTAHTLKGSESRRHDDNKQWFNLYLKLFIVMGISWSMEIISWLFKDSPQYIWYITDLTNTLQGLIIFLIFVCKEKIKRLLLKRFGCLGRDVLSRNSTRSAYHSSASRTCTTTAAPLQEKVNPYVTESYRTRNNFDDSDCA